MSDTSVPTTPSTDPTDRQAGGAGTYPLGDREVRRVGYGAMQLPGPGVFGPPRDRDEALRVLRRAVELGVDHIDTAQFYGPRVSNELIREALHPYGDHLALVSKVGATRDDTGAWLPAQRPEQLRTDVEDNLRTLGVDHLTAVNLRRTDEHTEGVQDEPAHVSDVPLEEQLGELVALRDEGKIAGIGLSTVTAAQLATARSMTEIVCVQNPFSLVDQKDAEVLEACTAASIAYVPYFPLGSAFPHLPKVVDQPAVKAVAALYDVPAARVGLAWLLARADNILLIPGTSSVAHLEENLAAGDLELSDDDLAELSGAVLASRE
ncbi:oxidoreductase [Intrasporangium flavum]|uniref:oxidoreductase n=1 Tax=Intrasporangium flavum TaxID=1428657 RepID=UPI0009F967A2|nr:oxidoreductase [Intrasporangium flavum]